MLLGKLIDRIIWLRKRRQFNKIGKGGSFGRGCKVIHPECIIIGDDFIAGKGVKMQAWVEFNDKRTENSPEIIIGNSVAIMDNCQISCADGIYIGSGTLFGENVFVTDNYHGKPDKGELEIPPHRRNLYIKGTVHIGKNVWIGRNVCIMPGVKIGDGAIIGANAVVTKNIPECSIAAGLPAKVIRQI